MLEDFTYATFADRVGDTFRVRHGSEDVTALELIEAADRTVRPPSGDGPAARPNVGESFAIVLHGPGDTPLRQGTYRFEHDGLGSFDLFIVPVGADNGGFHYEAVFNRLPPGSTLGR